MTKREMEKKLEEYLDERWTIMVRSDTERMSSINESHYRGACHAIAQIGGWERIDGKHFVKLN